MTFPPINSLNPVISALSTALIPFWVSKSKVPPVDTISNSAFISFCANSTIPVLSKTLIYALFFIKNSLKSPIFSLQQFYNKKIHCIIKHELYLEH